MFWSHHSDLLSLIQCHTMRATFSVWMTETKIETKIVLRRSGRLNKLDPSYYLPRQWTYYGKTFSICWQTHQFLTTANCNNTKGRLIRKFIKPNTYIILSTLDQKTIFSVKTNTKAHWNEYILTWSSKSGLVRLMDRFLINSNTCIRAKQINITHSIEAYWTFETFLLQISKSFHYFFFLCCNNQLRHGNHIRDACYKFNH